MKQSLLLLEAHQATVQIENIVHAKRAAHPGIVVGKKCSSLCHGGKPCKNEAECITPIWVSELNLNLDGQECYRFR